MPAAAEAIRACYGLSGEFDRLPGEADDNFLLTTGARRRYVVKFAHERADPRVVDVQVRVLEHLQAAAAELPVPRVMPAVGGQQWTVVGDGSLRGRVVHVVTYLDGRLLRSVRTTPVLRRDVGTTLARLGRAVWTVAAPTREEDAGEAFAQRVSRAIADMNRHGVAFAAFIADSLFSSDGIWPDPAGFLRPAIDAVHEAGGLYIADEVQPGFGRTGDAMWGFQRHGIVPDLAVMGKPMGNGMPIAGVAARPEILEEFGNKVRYFNTFGGNSVCVAAAAAVLDVIEAEGLRENARVVGRYLRDTLAEIAGHTPCMGAVRGAGLYAAADFIDPETGRPDGDAAIRVVNGLRERRVLISATGPHGSTLKIRPPLPFSRAHVDQLAAALSDTLRDLM